MNENHPEKNGGDGSRLPVAKVKATASDLQLNSSRLVNIIEADPWLSVDMIQKV